MAFVRPSGLPLQSRGLRSAYFHRHSRRNVPMLSLAASERKKTRRSLASLDVPAFQQTLSERVPSHSPLTRSIPTTLQINIGLTCNLACRHCHVESSPSRTETMPLFIADRLIQIAGNDSNLRTVDITGGAPEMHEQFRHLVSRFSQMGLTVIDRCNLTVLELPGQEDLASFLASNRVKVVASLPCYSPENVERQRGDGVFDSSIRALQQLNAAGYGRKDTGLELDLVYNPGGPSLPPSQDALEHDYKRELKRAFDIEFSNLICITNMPIKRFADDLLLRGSLQEYMDLLVSSFNPSTVPSVMCLDMVHVSWDGAFHDCDFNYALDMKVSDPLSESNKSLSVFDISSFSEMSGMKITTAKHCYGCTAGNGSSCGGTLS